MLKASNVEAPVLFPKLRQLHLEQSIFDPALLLQVIQSRCGEMGVKEAHIGENLDRVEIDLRGSVPRTVSYHAAVVETGLSISNIPSTFTLMFNPA